MRAQALDGSAKDVLDVVRRLGRIDVERDSTSNTLPVNRVWWEDGVRPVPLEGALDRLASFVGADPSTQ